MTCLEHGEDQTDAMVFEHVTPAQRVLFGSGLAAQHLAHEVERRRARRIMVLATPSRRILAERVCEHVSVDRWFDGVVQHVPVAAAEKARAEARRGGADLLVAVGGGSTVGLAKAVTLATGTPILAVPTTYAGSEATSVWGVTEQRTKRTGVDDGVLPATIVYDAELTRSLPVAPSVASGLNGLAHCVDSLWAPRANPINRALALEGARALVEALPDVVREPHDVRGREQALYGCYLAAVAFSSAGSGLHHKICHVLGGTFGLPHAETHAIVLPHVLALNGPGAPVADLERLAACLGAPAPDGRPAAARALASLTDLYAELDAPRRLADVGFTHDDINAATVRILEAAPTTNPAHLDHRVIAALLAGAVEGALGPIRQGTPRRVT